MATNTRSRVRGTGVVAPQRRDSIETKPFYLTSEFMATALMTVALFIASMVLEDLDSRLAWILGVSLVGVYVLSRGIAKAGTQSTAYDPREDLLDDRDRPLMRDRDENPRTAERDLQNRARSL
jgi:hypothetical protein